MLDSLLESDLFPILVSFVIVISIFIIWLIVYMIKSKKKKKELEKTVAMNRTLFEDIAKRRDLEKTMALNLEEVKKQQAKLNEVDKKSIVPEKEVKKNEVKSDITTTSVILTPHGLVEPNDEKELSTEKVEKIEPKIEPKEIKQEVEKSFAEKETLKSNVDDQNEANLKEEESFKKEEIIQEESLELQEVDVAAIIQPPKADEPKEYVSIDQLIEPDVIDLNDTLLQVGSDSIIDNDLFLVDNDIDVEELFAYESEHENTFINEDDSVENFFTCKEVSVSDLITPDFAEDETTFSQEFDNLDDVSVFDTDIEKDFFDDENVFVNEEKIEDDYFDLDLYSLDSEITPALNNQEEEFDFFLEEEFDDLDAAEEETLFIADDLEEDDEILDTEVDLVFDFENNDNELDKFFENSYFENDSSVELLEINLQETTTEILEDDEENEVVEKDALETELLELVDKFEVSDTFSMPVTSVEGVEVEIDNAIDVVDEEEIITQLEVISNEYNEVEDSVSFKLDDPADIDISLEENTNYSEIYDYINHFAKLKNFKGDFNSHSPVKESSFTKKYEAILKDEVVETPKESKLYNAYHEEEFTPLPPQMLSSEEEVRDIEIDSELQLLSAKVLGHSVQEEAVSEFDPENFSLTKFLFNKEDSTPAKKEVKANERLERVIEEVTTEVIEEEDNIERFETLTYKQLLEELKK